jgi:hypothetical protein
LLARVTETLKPADVLEHIWLRDIVDLSWEVFRLRRLKVELMSAAAWEGVAKVFEPFVDTAEAPPSHGPGATRPCRWPRPCSPTPA